MDRKLVDKILEVQSRAKQDPETKALLTEYEYTGTRLMALLPGMSDLQRDAVMDYIGVFGALQFRLLELALAGEEGTTEK